MTVRSSVPESRATSFTSEAYVFIGYQIALSIAHACLEFGSAKGPRGNNAQMSFMFVRSTSPRERMVGWRNGLRVFSATTENMLSMNSLHFV